MLLMRIGGVFFFLAKYVHQKLFRIWRCAGLTISVETGMEAWEVHLQVLIEYTHTPHTPDSRLRVVLILYSNFSG